MKVKISVASFIADDFVGLFEFYRSVFDLVEIPEMHTDIFRGADLDGVMLGFSSSAVYEMLNIEAWRDHRGTNQYLTFEAETDDEVTALTDTAAGLGATVLHEPYRTYYGSWQSVLADPQGNVFRINHF